MIELIQLEGRRGGRDGVVHIKHNVDQIMRDGVRLGFVGRFTGAPVVFLPQAQEAEREDIIKAVAKLREESGDYGPPSDKVNKLPPLIPAEEYDDDEDDDE